MKSNWIWVYIKYELEKGWGGIFYVLKGGWFFLWTQREGCNFFQGTDQIFRTPPSVLTICALI